MVAPQLRRDPAESSLVLEGEQGDSQLGTNKAPDRDLRWQL